MLFSESLAQTTQITLLPAVSLICEDRLNFVVFLGHAQPRSVAVIGLQSRQGSISDA